MGQIIYTKNYPQGYREDFRNGKTNIALTSTTFAGVPTGSKVTKVTGYFYLAPSTGSSSPYTVHYLDVKDGSSIAYGYHPQNDADKYTQSLPYLNGTYRTTASYLPRGATDDDPPTNPLVLSKTTDYAFSGMNIYVDAKITIGTTSAQTLVRDIYVVVEYEEPFSVSIVDNNNNPVPSSVQYTEGYASPGTTYTWTVVATGQWSCYPIATNGGNWVSVTPSSGSSGRTDIDVKLVTLPPAGSTYSTNINFTDSDLNIVKTITISMTMSGAAVTPSFTLSGSSIVDDKIEFSSSTKPSDYVSFNVYSNVDWQITRVNTSGGYWFALQTTYGSKDTNTAVDIEIMEVPPYGSTYSTTLQFKKSGDDTVYKTLLVTMTSSGSEPPSITISGSGFSNNTLTIDDSNITSYGSVTLNIDANYTWTVSTSSTWFTVSNYLDSMLVVHVEDYPVNTTYTGQATLSINGEAIKTITIKYTRSVTINATVTGTHYNASSETLTFDSSISAGGYEWLYITTDPVSTWTFTVEDKVGSNWLYVDKVESGLDTMLFVQANSLPSNSTYKSDIIISANNAAIKTIHVTLSTSGGSSDASSKGFPALREKEGRKIWSWSYSTNTYSANTATNYTLTTNDDPIVNGTVITRVMAYVKIAVGGNASSNNTFKTITLNISNGPSYDNQALNQYLTGVQTTLKVPQDTESGVGYVSFPLNGLSVFENNSITMNAQVTGSNSNTILWMKEIHVAVDYKIATITWNGEPTAEQFRPDSPMVYIRWNPVTAENGSGSVQYVLKEESGKEQYVSIGSPIYSIFTPETFNKEKTYTIVASYSGVTSEKTVKATVNGYITKPTEFKIKMNADNSFTATWTGSKVQFGGGTILQYDLSFTNDEITETKENIVTVVNEEDHKYTYNVADKINESNWTFTIKAIYSENHDITQTATFSFAVSYGRPVKYYNGSEWIDCIIYYYNGSDWIECEPYYYTGSGWQEI